ncbi:hypothetical protein L1887_37799 [Cichorium endivia]|nr:hypothetical protein L1887_37799 [Cichorium endivia]
MEDWPAGAVVRNSNGSNCWSAAANNPRRRLVFSRASSSSSPPETDNDKKKQDQSDGEEGINADVEGNQKASSVSVMKRLVDANPVGLGRRSRQIFDEAWRKFSELAQISETIRTNDESSLLIQEGGPMCEFAISGAQNTTVLVVGATSCVGRIVVRKLMLRGYSVKALVRNTDEEVVAMLPTSVKIVIRDVGDPATLRVVVENCSKIIYCATARSSITVDLNRVYYQGVYNLSKAFQILYHDYNNKLAQLRVGKSSKSKLFLAKFKSADSLNGWEVRKGTYFQDAVASKCDGGMDAKFEWES